MSVKKYDDIMSSTLLVWSTTVFGSFALLRMATLQSNVGNASEFAISHHRFWKQVLLDSFCFSKVQILTKVCRYLVLNAISNYDA